MMRRSLLLLFALIPIAQAERINQEGRILGPAPTVTAPTLFNTTAADAIVAAMQIMPRDNPWNEDISRRPLLANSDAMIAQITSDLSANRRTLRPFYEMNYVLVPDNQPRVTVPFFNYPDESDLDGGTYPNGRYPFPTNLPVETWPRGTGNLTLQQWQQDVNNTGGDRHAIVVAPGVGSIWETWLTKLTSTGWQASNGAKFNLNSNALRPAGWTSGDAAGLPMFPALVRYDECERGMVEHALRIVVAKSRREYIYPATHYASSIPATSINYPAMGQRVRLKASFVIPDSWTIEEKAVLRALKKYGALVADNGGFFSVSVCPDDRFAANAFDHLSTIGISNFEVIQTTGPAEGPRSPGAPAVDAGPDQFLEAPATISLNAAVNDPSGKAALLWKVYSGPAGVALANANQASTTATISTPGTYTFVFSADDAVHAVAYDAVVVRVTGHDALANISTRVQVGTSNNVAIAGFIVVGNAAKQVVVRGLGPSLTGAGVLGALADPVLELHGADGALLLRNDDWQETQAQALSDAGFAPTNNFESALLTTLSPGIYTAILQSNDGSPGIGLLEVYDLQQSPSSKLANISTRGLVGTGQNVMIGGTIVTGPDAGRVVFRALGPSLAANQIANPLSDPQLEIFNANGNKIGGNNNWKDTQSGLIAATGLAPTNDLESAILIDLSPGAYTAVVSIASGAAGVGLVEAYHLQ
ncbi:MAG: hypothetical protein QOF24_1625 [Verrucomicrobiota bacterium]|jgi:hypothetical protein